ncbi:MAG TPA: Bax inhibitor-1/YccA family protein [Chlorobiota bacterium]|nr:Bax inhibitor-1/YccA family protein [Chlorobiota bacterium]
MDSRQYMRQRDAAGDVLSAQQVAAHVHTDDMRAYVQKVYAWMTGGLMLTGLTAFGVASSPTILNAIFATPLYWLVLLAPLGMVFFLSARVDSMKPSTAAGTFLAYSIVNGMSFSALFLVYELGSIFQVFLIAGGMFGVSAAYGYLTKRDLTGVGSFMFMGLIGLIIASVVNWFMDSSVLDFAISVIGVLVFTGLTAYDMQRLRAQAVVMYSEAGLITKRAILSALTLYLDFVNLFLFLLRLLGDRR